MYRTDETGFGEIKVIQKKGYGYGVDAVLLAAFAAGETGAAGIGMTGIDGNVSGRAPVTVRIADLGTDCGIVAFILAHKIPCSYVLGIEKRSEAADRAREAVLMNGFEDRISIITADVNEIADGDKTAILSSFDAVVSNPPYFRKGSAIPSSSSDRFTARHETTAGIEGFSRAASAMLKTGGSFFLIHRPDRLADIFTSLRAADLEPKEMQMVLPHPGEPANLVLIHAVKGAGPQLKMLPEITVHNADGSYTESILRIYERY